MAYIYDLTDTWNAGGTTFNGIKLNVTDSASAVSSKLVTLQTNGTEHFSVTKAGVGYVSGSLGVGTSSPGAKLHVKSLAQSFIVEGTAARGSGNVYAAFNDPTGRKGYYGYGGGDDSFYLANELNAPMLFYTNDTERMRITAAGDVGIGTIDPASFLAKLAVVGNITASNGGKLYQFDGTNSTGRYMQALANSALSIGKYQAGGDVEQVRITAVGNVGIGTDSPSLKFVVSNAGGAGLEIDPTAVASAPVIQSYNRSGAAYTQLTYNALLHVWQTSGSERMRIDANGNLLINRSSTSGLGKLNVEGGADFTGGNVYLARDSGFVSSGSGSQVQAGKVGIMFNANTNQGLALQETAFGSGSSFILFANLSGTAIGSITQSGTSNVLYNTSSDARLKENVADSDDAASLIDAIQVRKFDWKADGIHQRYGFIAQELVEIVPEAVSVPKDPEDTMGVDYSKLVPMLVKEIQSLRARVAQLEGAA
jgi:hypothetical protein